MADFLFIGVHVQRRRSTTRGAPVPATAATGGPRFCLLAELPIAILEHILSIVFAIPPFPFRTNYETWEPEYIEAVEWPTHPGDSDLDADQDESG
mmetsp:Transcript_3633/g.10724  ORF Transcript_3633/g.10724 Transcript_3633/m.10724 type:complete len:95 (+) Transcript_3633:60-344(+)